MESDTTVWFLHRLGLTAGPCFGICWTSEETQITVGNYIRSHRHLQEKFPVQEAGVPAATSPMSLSAFDRLFYNAIRVKILPDWRDYFWENYHYLCDQGMANVSSYGDDNTEDDTVLEDRTAALMAAAHTVNMIFTESAEDDVLGEYQDDDYLPVYVLEGQGMQEEYHNEEAQGAQEAEANEDAPPKAERNDDLAYLIPPHISSDDDSISTE
jgi:hypothetical protein